MELELILDKSVNKNQLEALAKVAENFCSTGVPSKLQNTFDSTLDELIEELGREETKSSESGLIRMICLCAQFSSTERFSAGITRVTTRGNPSNYMNLLLQLLHSLPHSEHAKILHIYDIARDNMAEFLHCERKTANKVGLLFRLLLSGDQNIANPNSDKLCSQLLELLCDHWQTHVSTSYLILCSVFDCILKHMSQNAWSWIWGKLCEVRQLFFF